jgi:hypothetical protein
MGRGPAIAAGAENIRTRCMNSVLGLHNIIVGDETAHHWP